MRLRCFIADAFAEAAFTGNPAAVCVCETPLNAKLMQAVAAENNLPETAFIVPVRRAEYAIRWFTPVSEMDLCGHATLAAAFVACTILQPGTTAVRFQSPAGELSAELRDGRYYLDLPARPPRSVPLSTLPTGAFGDVLPLEAYRARDLVCLLRSEEEVKSVVPRLSLFRMQNGSGVVVTAPGSDCDFVSRYFAPELPDAEDPVTGSSHCSLVPLWTEKLGKTEFTARQLSRRGGTLYLKNLGARVEVGGSVRLYLSGEIIV